MGYQFLAEDRFGIMILDMSNAFNILDEARQSSKPLPDEDVLTHEIIPFL